MRRVFADTSHLIALLNSRDALHEPAVAFAGTPDIHMVTTVWVLAELADGPARSLIRSRVPAFVSQLSSDPACQVVSLEMKQFNRGLKLYRDRPDKSWSLTDCISFVVMEDEGLTEALTADRHFEQAGFHLLLSP